ncbi:protein-methionine-sulfoxide reductase catalytic subunit MsrP [Cohaesibacter celericrescens]|uniref:Protein-methionine-sulfoxide reductase catalytic subunit MsrP n=1 Tax=Cohaesibacter celericrescens TaxID=2067669 RepID=A0A2N5XX83_9HYPH|nr:protein-methionine-sulfoxide reductase catalytic subunit MsrP [Cohaesibacter celericrescens]PLW79123.1 protein-methionine-sulfoxide reductase catalytic subunit MsrP [Cohaesibacter celericrescens]
MLIKAFRPWSVKESLATDEQIYMNRRKFMRGSSLLIGGATLSLAGCNSEVAHDVADDMTQSTSTSDYKDPTMDLYPAKRNEAYKLERAVTDETVNATYNNFYEFGSHKHISKAAQALQTRPWTVKIDGLVEEEMELDIDSLIRAMSLEERLYRHRCVEAWSMTIPWTGFAFADLVKKAKPLSGAKYIQMETFQDSQVASGQKQSWYPWPYTEGVSIEEAMNELAFLVTGAYGKPMAKQFGAPLRLALPWKYGFKSIKSIVRFTFTDQRPVSFWEQLAPKEYGFWANVNPEVRHPRWSQANETVLGTDDTIPTQMYNGYADQVAHLYKELGKTEILFR